MGPDGSTICDHIPDGSTVRVDVIDPVNATEEVPFAGQQWLTCPANSFSIAVPEGIYRLRVQLPRDPVIDPLPFRWLEPGDMVVPAGGTVVQDIRVMEGAPVGGTGTLDGVGDSRIQLQFLYDFETPVGFAPGAGASRGISGDWGDRVTGGWRLMVQKHVRYRASCLPSPWPFDNSVGWFDVGYRLVQGPPQEPFLFPSEISAINCWYESVSDVPYLGVTANNYQLVLRPEWWAPPEIGTGFFRDGVAAHAVMFGGGIAYTTDAEHTFILDDPSGRTNGNMLAVGLPVEVREPGGAPGLAADHWTRIVLKERPEDPYWNASALDLVVVRETFAWSTPPDDDYIIFKYTLFNAGRQPIRGLTVGQALDHDLTILNGQYSNNYVWLEGDQLVALIHEPSGDLWAAHGLMLPFRPNNYRSWAANPETLPNDPDDLSTWHDYLTGGIVGPDPFGPADIRHLLSIGFRDIPPRSFHYFFTILAGGDSEDDVLANVRAAKSKAMMHPYWFAPWGNVQSVDISIKGTGDDGFEVSFVFKHPRWAEMFDPSQTFCSGAQGQTANRLGRGSTVVAEFQRSHVDPWIDDGDQMICVARLTDGHLFTGGARARFK